VMREYGYHHLQHLAFCGLLDIFFNEVDTTARFGDGISEHKTPAGGFGTNELGMLFVHILLDKVF